MSLFLNVNCVRTVHYKIIYYSEIFKYVCINQFLYKCNVNTYIVKVGNLKKSLFYDHGDHYLNRANSNMKRLKEKYSITDYNEIEHNQE